LTGPDLSCQRAFSFASAPRICNAAVTAPRASASMPLLCVVAPHGHDGVADEFCSVPLCCNTLPTMSENIH